MRATAGFLAVAAAVSAMGAVFPSLAAGDGATASQFPAQQRGANDFAMPPEMIEKLSPEQIMSVLREREMRRATFSGRPADIVGTTLFFGALVTMVLLAQVFATARERIRQETLRAMVDKGMEIPPGLVGDRARRSSDLRRGLVLVGAGLGLSLVFALVHVSGQSGSGLWSIGLIPMLMGAGYLVVWRIESRKSPGR